MSYGMTQVEINEYAEGTIRNARLDWKVGPDGPGSWGVNWELSTVLGTILLYKTAIVYHLSIKGNRGVKFHEPWGGPFSFREAEDMVISYLKLKGVTPPLRNQKVGVAVQFPVTAGEIA